MATTTPKQIYFDKQGLTLLKEVKAGIGLGPSTFVNVLMKKFGSATLKELKDMGFSQPVRKEKVDVAVQSEGAAVQEVETNHTEFEEREANGQV